MKKIKIRKSVFETNSSSSHSLAIDNTDMLLDVIIPNDEGVITINPREFGWKWVKYNEAQTKASYCLTGTLYVGDRTQEALDNIREVIQEHTLCNQVELIEPSKDWDNKNYAYIDHQSVEDGEMNDLLFDKSKLHNFIWNKNSWLFLGNDNEDAPNKFYDTKKLTYKWRLVFPDCPSVSNWEFSHYPNKEQLIDALWGLSLRFVKILPDMEKEDRDFSNVFIDTKGESYLPEQRSNSYCSWEEYYDFRDWKSKITDTTISFVNDMDEDKHLLINYKLEEIN